MGYPCRAAFSQHEQPAGLGPAARRAGLGNPRRPGSRPQRLWLANRAIGASGTAVRGAHIIDPRTGRPAEGKFRTWALAATAAEADALSTAFMVMADDEVADYCRLHPGIEAYLLKTPAGELLTMAS